MRVTFLILGVVVAVVPSVGCRGRNRGTAGADVRGVGFELQGSTHVERGAIVTKPAGREEAFLSFVAGFAPVWIEECLDQAGSQAPMFGFATTDKGAPAKLTPEVGKTARDRCLSARAAASVGAVLPERTSVTVQLALKLPTAPDAAR